MKNYTQALETLNKLANVKKYFLYAHESTTFDGKTYEEARNTLKSKGIALPCLDVLSRAGIIYPCRIEAAGIRETVTYSVFNMNTGNHCPLSIGCVNSMSEDMKAVLIDNGWLTEHHRETSFGKKYIYAWNENEYLDYTRNLKNLLLKYATQKMEEFATLYSAWTNQAEMIRKI